MKTTCLSIAASVFAFFSAQPLVASSPVNTSGGVALDGYDPVAFFTDHQPEKGKSDLAAEHAGAKYLFTSEAHQKQFKDNPEKYVPQYGGYCAYGVAKGKKVPIKIETWQIVDGKLYLNYDRGTQKKFNENPHGYIDEANQRWSTVKNQ